MYQVKLLVGGFLSFLLIACGGGSNAVVTKDTIQTPTGTITVEKINDIIVPPDPGLKKNESVAGVDSDHNGIRDEIDRWIATKYGDKPGAIDAIQMSARSRQKHLTSNPTTNEAALTAIYKDMDTGGCIGEKLRNERVNTDEFFDESYLRTYNTRARIDEYKRIGALAGPIIRDTSISIINCPYHQRHPVN